MWEFYKPIHMLFKLHVMRLIGDQNEIRIEQGWYEIPLLRDRDEKNNELTTRNWIETSNPTPSNQKDITPLLPSSNQKRTQSEYRCWIVWRRKQEPETRITIEYKATNPRRIQHDPSLFEAGTPRSKVPPLPRSVTTLTSLAHVPFHNSFFEIEMRERLLCRHSWLGLNVWDFKNRLMKNVS